jgi:hypothetical protein
MLDDLERNVDRTDSKLSGAMQRMKKFIRQTEGELQSLLSSRKLILFPETKSGWCIVILIIILMALLLAVILV